MDSTALKKEGFLIPPAIFIGVLMILAAAFSVFVWMGQGLRLDEAQSIWQTSRDIGGVVEVIAKDVHMPLYFVALHYWELFFGTSELAIRSLSLLFFLLSIPVMFFLGLRASLWLVPRRV